ncbi:hypothetical protein EVAR_13869_1 [Eumeta japonica]|uniref:Uncharacterized protein n=1 Tax=Eumeta variegata TaxID=151549 RepID=A0A4C1U1N2_EUMVA|nr:hypothetical protein EVAR_13869_1 [Eumeta japonica]
MSGPKVRVVKKKATAKTHPIDMPIENVNGEGSGQNYVEAPDQNNEERSDQNSVEILYQNNEERPDKKAKGFPGVRFSITSVDTYEKANILSKIFMILSTEADSKGTYLPMTKGGSGISDTEHKMGQNWYLELLNT